MANAILGAIMSLIIPGLGQAYAGDIKKGAIFFVIFIVLAILFNYVFIRFLPLKIGNIPINILGIFWALYSAFDAYSMAKE